MTISGSSAIMAEATARMDSREIAELTGKEHRKVCRDIEEYLGRLEGGVARFEHTYRNDQNGQEYPCYLLPYRETMILVSGYSVELRARVIDRWMELERKALAPSLPDFMNPAAAARAWADEVDAKHEALKALAEAQPAIESHAALMRTDRTMSITDAAKHFGLHPKTEVFPYLREHGYLTRKDIPTEAAIVAGYLALKESPCTDGIARPQAVVEARMLETWRTRVIPQIAKWIKEGAA